MEELQPRKVDGESAYDLKLTSFFFESQRLFNSRFMDVESFVRSEDVLATDPKEDPRVYWTLDISRAAMVEASELMYEMPWKHWQDYSDWEPRVEKIQEETIDIFNFIIGVGISMGLTPEDAGSIRSYFDQYRTEDDENPFDELDYAEKSMLTIENIDRIQNQLMELRSQFPWDSDLDYSDWKPDYPDYIERYRELLSTFARQCLIWDVDEKKLYEEYVNKRMKTVENIGNGYKWDPNVNFED